MKEKRSLIKFNNNFPINVDLVKLTGYEKDWHTTIKLIIVLEGEATISVNDETFNLKENEVFLVNSWEIYVIYSISEFVYLELDIDLSKYNTKPKDYNVLKFRCNSLQSYDKSEYKQLKKAVFKFVRINNNDEVGLVFKSNSLAYQILYLLMNQYLIDSSEIKELDSKYLKTLQEIVGYIEENYKNNISLLQISSHFGYTPQYFSTFFKKYMNQNFQNYYDNLRISKTISPLIDTDMPLEQIAIENGFIDYRSYIRAFRNKYETTPSEFRKRKELIEKDYSSSYISFNTKHYLDKIYQFEDDTKKLMNPKRIKGNSINIDYSQKGTRLQKTFLNTLGVNSCSDLLKGNTKKMLEEIQNDIGFKYIRFNGLLSDDMSLYKRTLEGEEIISFVYIDEVFDYIRSLKLKPFLHFSFMPNDLAYNPNKKVYEAGYIMSKPKNLNDWINLVLNVVNHMINRYGLDEVILWPISIWSSPDSISFGFDDKLDFFEFYRRTYKAIKNISSKLMVGSPDLLPFSNDAYEWDKEFLSYCLDNNCYPDFLNVHYYMNVFDLNDCKKRVERLNKDPDSLSKFIDKIKSQTFYRNEKINLTEWSLTTSHRNLLNDTIFISAFLVKNILQNMDRLESFTKWSLTDLTNQTQLPDQMYHGGLGLFTYNGVKKAGYNAIKLLSKLCNTVVASDDGYYVTKDKEKFSIMLYNYEHYNDIYADGEYLSVDRFQRYNVFRMNKKNNYIFNFNELDFDYAIIKITRITKESGSSYDIYSSMSDIELAKASDVEDLKGLSIPKYEIYKRDVINNSLDLTVELNPLEVKLVEIKLFK